MDSPFSHGPSLLRSRLARMMSAVGFMPRIIIVCDPDESGRSLSITYRAYYTFWMGDPHYRCFYGLPEVVKTTSGDCLYKGRSWNRVTCDRIEWDTRTGVGQITFDPSNPSY